MADIIVTADAPSIPSGARPASAVLHPSELSAYDTKVEATSWEAGAAGQKMLSVYLNDGKSGTSRPVLIQFKAYSQFGLDFFKKKKNEKGFAEDDEEEELPKKKGRGKGKDKDKKEETKPKQKPALITFDYNKSPHVQVVDNVLTRITNRVMSDQGYLTKLKSLVAPGSEDKVTAVLRPAARASSGRVKKGLRASAYLGGCEFRDSSGKKVCYNDFTKNYKGDYVAIVEFGGISASYKEGVLSYGPVLYVKKLAIDTKVQRPELEWREDDDERALVDLTKETEERVTKKRKLEEETNESKEK